MFRCVKSETHFTKGVLYFRICSKCKGDHSAKKCKLKCRPTKNLGKLKLTSIRTESYLDRIDQKQKETQVKKLGSIEKYDMALMFLAGKSNNN